MQTLATLSYTASAVARLGADHPILADHLGRVQVIEDAELTRTIAADDGRVVVNPAFIKAHDEDRRVYVLAFAALMTLNLQAERKGDRDVSIWRLACNMAIHQQLAEGNLPGRPSEADFLHVDEARGLTAEEIYDRLVDGRIAIGGRTVAEMKAEIARWPEDDVREGN